MLVARKLLKDLVIATVGSFMAKIGIQMYKNHKSGKTVFGKEPTKGIHVDQYKGNIILGKEYYMIKDAE